jgi:serine/threonine protein kinase
LDGEPMGQRLKRAGRFALIDCLRLVYQMCTALEVAHRQSIVHCDLKPGNLFLVGDRAVAGGERVKILDFGIAKLLGDQPGAGNTGAGMLMGTPSYMSPEQCRGRSDIDARSDIYSLACVMFAMLTGRPPFRSKLPGDLISAHLREEPPLVSSLVADLPPAVDEIVQRCLAKSPEDRYPSMTELAEAIAAAQEALGEAVPMSAAPGTLTRVLAEIASVRPDPSTLHLASGQSVIPSQPAARPLQHRLRRRRPLVPLVIAAGVAAGVVVGIGTAPLPASPTAVAPAVIVPSAAPPSIDAGLPIVPAAKSVETIPPVLPIEPSGPARTNGDATPQPPAVDHKPSGQRLRPKPVRKGDIGANHSQSPANGSAFPHFDRSD